MTRQLHVELDDLCTGPAQRLADYLSRAAKSVRQRVFGEGLGAGAEQQANQQGQRKPENLF